MLKLSAPAPVEISKSSFLLLHPYFWWPIDITFCNLFLEGSGISSQILMPFAPHNLSGMLDRIK
jgi:hypothetical protein